MHLMKTVTIMLILKNLFLASMRVAGEQLLKDFHVRWFHRSSLFDVLEYLRLTCSLCVKIRQVLSPVYVMLVRYL